MAAALTESHQIREEIQRLVRDIRRKTLKIEELLAAEQCHEQGEPDGGS